MDGLSAAASGMAVVSLVIQLVDSVREIRRFLRSISEAPEELKRLVDLLEQLELILEQVGTLVQRQQLNARLETDGVLASVLKAIKTCESKLTKLEEVVAAAKKASSPSRAAKTLGSIRLACKKKDVREIEQQVHEAVSLLSLTMMANLTYVHSDTIGQLHTEVSASHQTTTMISRELVLLRTDLLSKPKEISNFAYSAGGGTDLSQIKSSRRKIFKSQTTISQTYTSIFGRLLVRRVSKPSNFEDESEGNAKTDYASTNTWVFFPSFLSRRFEYQAFHTCGFVQRAIRIYPIISTSHPVWEMCETGNLQGVQKLLSTREISLFSVDTLGCTLLQEAILYSNAKLSEFLFDMGLTCDGCPYVLLGDGLDDKQLSDLNETYTLTKTRCNDFNATDFYRIFCGKKGERSKEQ